MLRRLIGRAIEWMLSYEHEVLWIGKGHPPFQKYADDAGWDLHSMNDVIVKPGTVVDIPTGVFIDPKSNIWFELRGRSSTIRNKKLQVQTGVIDHGWRGELFICVYNPGNSIRKIKAGERIAQIIPHLVIPCRFKFGVLAPSERGSKGFGSTG